jgi:hypothetical protein
MTLLDKWDSFKEKYYSRSDIGAISGTVPKADPAFQSTDYDASNRKFSSDNFTPEKRRRLAYASPIYIKGITKKGADTFRAGFELERPFKRTKAADFDLKLIAAFNRHSNIWSKLRIADRCSHIYGDGLILIKYVDDNTDGEGGAPDVTVPAPSGSKPFDLELLDPETVYEMKLYEEDKRFNWKKLNIQHFHLKAKGGAERYIHPDRVLAAPRNKLPFQKLGTSDIDILADILNSYADINIATGEILKWFSHGIINVTKEGMGDEERKELLKELSKHNNIYANDKRYELEIITGEAIDPRAFYDFILQNIAGVIGMPTHMLTGVVVGRSSGAETGYADYYRDVRDDQDLMYTPLLNKLYSQLLKAWKREFTYDIIWNQIFIDEKAEGEVDKLRAESVQILKNAGVIDNKESRHKMNKGFVELDVEKVIKQPTQKPLGLATNKPNGKEKKNADSDGTK